jgi:hypothetical protein
MKKNNYISLLCLALLLVSGCSSGDLRRSIGVNKGAPDEFMVLTRNKLEIPSNLSLPVPGTSVGASEKSTSEKAKNDLFGKSSTEKSDLSALEENILNKTASVKEEDNIKKIIEKEHKENESSWVDDIIDPFGYNRSQPEVINPVKENRRIKKAIFEGKKVKGESNVTKKYRKLR